MRRIILAATAALALTLTACGNTDPSTDESSAAPSETASATPSEAPTGTASPTGETSTQTPTEAPAPTEEPATDPTAAPTTNAEAEAAGAPEGLNYDLGVNISMVDPALAAEYGLIPDEYYPVIGNEQQRCAGSDPSICTDFATLDAVFSEHLGVDPYYPEENVDSGAGVAGPSEGEVPEGYFDEDGCWVPAPDDPDQNDYC